MHLDTVFTMIDYDKFTMHSAILKAEGNMNIFIIEYDDVNKDIAIKQSSHLKDTLEDVLGIDDINSFQQEMVMSLMVLESNGMMAQIHYV